MKDDSSVSDVARRTLLKATAGSLGIAAVGQVDAQAPDEERTTTSNSARDARSSDTSRENAAEWVSNALWTATGTATEFPGQVVFPRYSHLAVTAMNQAGLSGHIGPRDAALAASRLQDKETGGFYRQQGDFLGPWTTATYHAVSLAQMFDISIDESAATEFLLDHQNDSGGFIPRSGFLGGKTISTLAATYKSTAALSQLSAVTQSIRDRIVDFVQSAQHTDGGWAATPHSNSSTVAGTYHAINTLLSLNALDAKTKRQAGSFLLSLQQPRGGFRGTLKPTDCSSPICRRRPEVTTRNTAQALLTLSKLGNANPLQSAMERLHVDWLVDRQLLSPTDERFHGGFETYRERTASITHYLLNTAFAMNALRSVDALDRIDQQSAGAFIAACQHPGSDGFASWPSSLSSMRDTEAAVRALDQSDAIERFPRDSLARTLAGQQRSDGSIAQLDWDNEPTVKQTAQAVLAAAQINRTNSIDRASALSFIADHQHQTGGFTNTSTSRSETSDGGGDDPSLQTTWLAVRAVSAMNGLTRIDRRKVSEYLAGLQGDDGQISSEQPTSLTAVRDTRYAMEILTAIGRLSVVDLNRAISYLASRQQRDGTYENESMAVHVTTGLAAADALSEIDLPKTQQYLRKKQLPSGGFAKKGFYSSATAMQRHAGVVEALSVLRAQ